MYILYRTSICNIPRTVYSYTYNTVYTVQVKYIYIAISPYTNTIVPVPTYGKYGIRIIRV